MNSPPADFLHAIPPSTGATSMSPPPRFTIVTPSFNQARFLEATIASVLDQDYPQVEYIVLDGGSTDGSVDIIRRYADRLACWVSTPDRGQADAIARGFRLGSGNILGWLNSDDLLLPGCLSRVAREFAHHPDVGVVYGSRVLIDAEGREVGRYSPPTILSRLYFSLGQWLPQESSFWRRSVYDAAGGLDTSLYFCLDYSLFVRMWPLTRFRRMRATLGALRVHPDTKTSRSARVMEEENEVIRRAHRLQGIKWPPLRRSLELAVYGQAALERHVRGPR